MIESKNFPSYELSQILYFWVHEYFISTKCHLCKMSPFQFAIFSSVLFGVCVIAQETIVPAEPHEFPFQVEIKALIHLASGSILTKVNKKSHQEFELKS